MTIARLDIHAYRHQRIVAVPFPLFFVARVQAGSKQIIDGARRVQVAAGHYIAVSPGTFLNLENRPPPDGPYRSSCLSVSHALLRSSFPRCSAPPQAWAVIAPDRALDQAYAHTEQGLGDGLPDALLQHRLRELLEALALAGFTPAMQAEPGTVERVRMLLAADPSHAWRAEHAAEHLAMSVATLRRRLAAERSSFRLVLEEVRLTHALLLIQSTVLPLKSIAMASGYLSASRFATRFRHRFGTLPSALRA